jgi:hypothetical protein
MTTFYILTDPRGKVRDMGYSTQAQADTACADLNNTLQKEHGIKGYWTVELIRMEP